MPSMVCTLYRSTNCQTLSLGPLYTPLLVVIHWPVSDSCSMCIRSMIGWVFIFSSHSLHLCPESLGICVNQRHVSFLTNLNSGSNMGSLTCIDMYAYHRHQNAFAVQLFSIKCVSGSFCNSCKAATIFICCNLCFINV